MNIINKGTVPLPPTATLTCFLDDFTQALRLLDRAIWNMRPSAKLRITEIITHVSTHITDASHSHIRGKYSRLQSCELSLLDLRRTVRGPGAGQWTPNARRPEGRSLERKQF